MSSFGSFLIKVLGSTFNMINGASVWIVISFAIAGVLHELLDTSRLRSSAICSKKFSGVFFSTISGMMIPVCSCGSIPLGIGLYHSGAYLGPTLAFMTSCPMINPISIILAYGLLGKEIATVYVLTGLLAPLVIGTIANRVAGPELHLPEREDAGQRISVTMAKQPLLQRLKSGMRWSFGELAVMVSKYTVTGMLITSFLFNIVPQSYIQRYLGDPGLISLFGITIIASLMYVCAVGHIPMIAAIVASGAAPGVAITFLMAGAATNFSELLTINRTIGKRAMTMYFILVVLISNAVGYLTNRLFKDFKPVLDYDEATHSISAANHFIFDGPAWISYLCSAVIVGCAVWALVRFVRKKMHTA